MCDCVCHCVTVCVCYCVDTLCDCVCVCDCVCAVNKQLADKERVAAALENAHLLMIVNQCLGAKPI